MQWITDAWADYGDYAEDMWSDDDHDIDADEDYPYPTEDAYLDSYWESLTEM